MAPRPYQQHGLHTLKRQIKAKGLSALDGRSQMARELGAWRRELELGLGGREQLSAQQRAVIELAVTTKLLLDSIDRWLLDQESLINKRRRSVYPVVLQRGQLADALSRYVGQLGLERRRGIEVLALDAHLAKRYGRRNETVQPGDKSPGEFAQDARSDPETGGELAHTLDRLTAPAAGDDAPPGAVVAAPDLTPDNTEESNP